MSRDDGVYVEHLAEPECWDLLGRSRVGRIGVLVDSAPEIYPMNFAVMEQTSLVFRTDAGSKLRGLERSPSVCFEVDDVHPDLRTGWSVLVKGRAVELLDPDDVDRARRLPLELWTIGDKSRWFRVDPSEVTGRRIERVVRSEHAPASHEPA